MIWWSKGYKYIWLVVKEVAIGDISSTWEAMKSKTYGYSISFYYLFRLLRSVVRVSIL